MVVGCKINVATADTLLAQPFPHTFRTISLPFLWRSLIVVCCATKCCSDYAIELDIITAFLDQPYYVRCTVSFSSFDSIPPGPPLVIFEHNNIVKCVVQDWKTCAVFVPAYTGECGCNFLYRPGLPDRSVYYRMFYYLANVTKAYRDTSFRCIVAGRFDFGTMNIIDFTLRPNAETLYNCSGGQILLPWEFEPVREEVPKRIQVLKYEWIFQHHDRRTITTIATFDFINKIGTSKFSDAIIVDDGRRLRKLRIINLSHSHIGIIRIRVEFNGTKLNEPWKPKTGPPDTQPLLSNLSNRIHNDDEYKNYQDIGQVKREIANEPPLPEYIEDEVKLFMTNVNIDKCKDSSSQLKLFDISIEFILKWSGSPPSLITITIKAKTDSYGYTNIICKGKTKFYGVPPVNLTLYDHKVALVSRSHGRAISHKSLTIEKGNYSCGLTGHALACLPPTDNRCRRSMLDMTRIESEEGRKALDVTLIIYYFETAVCLLLVLWASSLLLDHMVLSFKLKHTRDKMMAKHLREPKKERKALYQDIRTRRLSAEAEAKERRRSLSIALARPSLSQAQARPSFSQAQARPSFNQAQKTRPTKEPESSSVDSSDPTTSTTSSD